MDTPLKAIEATGTVDSQGQLHLDQPIAVVGPSRVRINLLFPEATEPSEREWLQAAATNPAFDFLNDPAEDIYIPSDGKPFRDER